MSSSKVLGILGGLGPLASAQFLMNIYKNSSSTAVSVERSEQHLPRVIMISDPSFPDRTETLLLGNPTELVRLTEAALCSLEQMGATETLICCLTLHAIVPLLSARLREKLILLPDLALEEVVRNQKPVLMLSSIGARRLKIFQNSTLWNDAEEFVIFPNTAEQERIHKTIYQLKLSANLERDTLSAYRLFESLAIKYNVDHLICGCTEFHLVSSIFSGVFSGEFSQEFSDSPSSFHNKKIIFIDPLQLASKGLQRSSYPVPKNHSKSISASTYA